MDGIKAFLTRQIGPLPVYAYGVGLLALGLGYWYFTRHNTGQATAAPQTNYPADSSGSPLPYPGGGGFQPGVGTTAVPPSPAFDASGGSFLQPTSNFDVAPPQPTTSQVFANSVGGIELQQPQPTDVLSIAAMAPIGGPNASTVPRNAYTPAPQNRFTQGIVAAVRRAVATSIPALNQSNPVSAYGRGN